MNTPTNIEILDGLIIGRVTPHIYAFTTNTVPNYLKIGDTYRPVQVRLDEWKRHFPDLVHQYDEQASVTDDVYFRDHAVHHYLEHRLGKHRLSRQELTPGLYFSREFFKDTVAGEVEEAIGDIREQYANRAGVDYAYYDANQRLSITTHYERGPVWQLRPNQQETVDNFTNAVAAGRTNLLMYAVMRFGKSFTSLACAKAMEAKTVLIVSAKADVREEWKKNVERPGNFNTFAFLDAGDLRASESAIHDAHVQSTTAVVFLTLQDLKGSEIKEKHQEIFSSDIDLLIIDETHFGARATSFGEVLRNASSKEQKKEFEQDGKILAKQTDEQIDIESADSQIKSLNARIRLHLSGTPYRILMGSEFEPVDIISFVQFSDIFHEQAAWDAAHIDDDNVEEWDNPYFGFPQMIRFAFNPSQAAIDKMNELKEAGISFAFSALLKPCSIREDKDGNHKQFVHETEVLDLLRVIDGSQQDANVLGFLDYDKIKQGKMCRHMVMVLPYCASCDAMKQLITEHRGEFKNLDDYEIINISGVDAHRRYKTPEEVKARIAQYEEEGKKTLTLTVNRMLTGSTVEQWDTMLYLKDTASPQEYDQAIFRLQNQYVRELTDGKNLIKENLKPQTLLVDFDPHRLFAMQEQKSFIYNANTDKAGNAKLGERIEEELKISPVITINHNKIERVEAADILSSVSRYNNSRSIADEVRDLSVDPAILADERMRRIIEDQNPFGSQRGLTLNAHEGEDEGSDLDLPDTPDDDQDDETKQKGKRKSSQNPSDDEDIKDLEKRLQTYYQRLLFFAFLCPAHIHSLDEIIEAINTGKHDRLTRNLGLEVGDLKILRDALNPFALSALDYKIQNISTLATDESLEPLERAVTSLAKFSRMSSSEIITPMNIADEMITLIPAEQFKENILSGQKILDIASKSGEYAVAAVKRLKEIGLIQEQYENAIYSIPTSGIAYEFTRRFYEILGLKTDCIAEQFNAYDLLEVKDESGEVDYGRIADTLRQDELFKLIDLDNQTYGGGQVEFAAVVGNPPYHKTLMGTSNPPIYPYFLDIGYELSTIACFICPGRFLFNVGKTPKKWNRKMLSDPHLSVPFYEPLSSKVFPNTGFKGGIAITLRDTFETHEPIDTYTPYPELNRIVQKVKNTQEFSSWKEEIYLQQKLNLEALYNDYPEYRQIIGSNGRERRLTTAIFSQLALFSDYQKNDTDLKILGLVNNKRVWKYIPQKYLLDHPNTHAYKVVIPKSNGSGALGEALSTPLIGEPLTGVTQSFITFGCYATKDTAERALKYIKSKMCRVLLGSRKATQDNNPPVWSNVPIQNFTSGSDIDWSVSIQEIDTQLYKKYGLAPEEIEFIETHVSPME